MQQQTSKAMPAKWPSEDLLVFRTVLNVVSTYAAGLKTGQRRIEISPVTLYVPAQVQS